MVAKCQGLNCSVINVCILFPLFSALDHSDCDNTCYFIGYYQ